MEQSEQAQGRPTGVPQPTMNLLGCNHRVFWNAPGGFGSFAGTKEQKQCEFGYKEREWLRRLFLI
jgi:hypothetical protein